MRILFAGSPAIASPCLKALLEAGETIVAVLSQPDRPVGRGQQMLSPAIAQLAKEKGLKLLQPEKIRHAAFYKDCRALDYDLMVVVAYGKMLPREILEIPKYGCLNIHYSLLPKYRGAAPVQWALINGEVQTGVTSMFLNEKMDAGDILLQKKIMIPEEDDSALLSQRLATMGAELLLETLEKMTQGTLARTVQNEAEASFAPLLKKEDGLLDWKRPAKALYHQIRGMNPWPSTFTFISEPGGAPKRLKIMKALFEEQASQEAPGCVHLASPGQVQIACGRGLLEPLVVQLEGARPLGIADFLKGHPLAVGQKLG